MLVGQLDLRPEKTTNTSIENYQNDKIQPLPALWEENHLHWEKVAR